MNDLTPEGLLETMKNLWSTPTVSLPQVIMSPQNLEDARAMAKRDPEFARQVLAEFGVDLLQK